MAIQIGCPHCQESYRLAEAQVGKRVRCRKCGETFRVEQEEDVPVLAEASAEDIRLYGRSRRRSGDADRDELEEAPRSSRHVVIILVACFAGVLILGAGGGLAWFFAARSKPSNTQAGNTLPTEIDPGAAQPGQGENNPGANPPIPVQPPVEVPPPKDVPTALTHLKDSERSRKSEALRFLNLTPIEESQRVEVGKALDTMLSDDPALASEILPVLRRWAPKTALERLARRLQDSNNSIAGNAMDELSQIDDERAAELIATQFKEFGRRHDAARNLKRMGKRAEKYMLPYYNDPDFLTRNEARDVIKTLGTSDEEIIKQTAGDLESTNRERRKQALDELARFSPSDKETKEKVSRILDGLLTSDERDSSNKALDALQTWATNENVPALCEALTDLFKLKKAVTALGKLKDDRMIKPLILQLNTSERLAIAKILVGYGPKAEPDVQPLLSSTFVNVRVTAVAILAEVGTKDSIKPLTRYINFRIARKDKEEAAIGKAALAKIQARLKAKLDSEKEKKKDKDG